MVAELFPENSSSQKRTKIDDLPVPESPINNNFNGIISGSIEAIS